MEQGNDTSGRACWIYHRTGDSHPNVYCIRNEYTSTAAWLTASVGLAEVIIGAGLTGYLNLAKSDHKEGGITFESAKAAGFKQDSEGNYNSPAI